MFKAMLIDTLPQFSYDPVLLAVKSGISIEQLQAFLEPKCEDGPTATQFAAIMKALPISIKQLLPESALDELSYLDAQLALVESTSADVNQPMFGGMRRLISRLIQG